ncbi:hypothetical protein MUK42_09423 [Musa troglodytarum]|uniref:Uncharacterized protein n=1 Tax=Musa troglodytarum TaxID=320322 RepID=A0A9E7EVG6_9LILI|nr:hypothetical protein MUK42_09423 [Musa troglodytarum]
MFDGLMKSGFGSARAVPARSGRITAYLNGGEAKEEPGANAGKRGGSSIALLLLLFPCGISLDTSCSCRSITGVFLFEVIDLFQLFFLAHFIVLLPERGLCWFLEDLWLN